MTIVNTGLNILYNYLIKFYSLGMLIPVEVDKILNKNLLDCSTDWKLKSYYFEKLVNFNREKIELWN